MPVEVLGLQDPGGSGLVEQRPEDRHEDVDHTELENRTDSLPAEGLAKPVHAPGGHVHELVPATPEEERRDAHQHARNAEREVWSVPLEEPGGEQGRKERPDIDREVEPPEDLAEQVSVGFAELVTHVSGDAGLDATGSEGDESQSEEQHPSGIDPFSHSHQGQGSVPDAVDDAQDHDRQVLAEQDVTQQRPEDRGEVDRRGEQVVVGDRVRVGHRLGPDRTGHHEEIGRHEHDQDSLHPIEAESLRGLVADDVGDAPRHLLGGYRGCQIGGHRFDSPGGGPRLYRRPSPRADEPSFAAIRRGSPPGGPPEREVPFPGSKHPSNEGPGRRVKETPRVPPRSRRSFEIDP